MVQTTGLGLPIKNLNLNFLLTLSIRHDRKKFLSCLMNTNPYMTSDDLQYNSALILNSVSVEKVENINFHLSFLTFQTKLNLKPMNNNILSCHWHVRD